jgi:hypothetical protein
MVDPNAFNQQQMYGQAPQAQFGGMDQMGAMGMGYNAYGMGGGMYDPAYNQQQVQQ